MTQPYSGLYAVFPGVEGYINEEWTAITGNQQKDTYIKPSVPGFAKKHLLGFNVLTWVFRNHTTAPQGTDLYFHTPGPFGKDTTTGTLLVSTQSIKDLMSEYSKR